MSAENFGQYLIYGWNVRKLEIVREHLKKMETFGDNRVMNDSAVFPTR